MMTADEKSHDGPGEGDSGRDAQVDEVEKESFPASDPQSSWAGRDREPDE